MKIPFHSDMFLMMFLQDNLFKQAFSFIHMVHDLDLSDIYLLHSLVTTSKTLALEPFDMAVQAQELNFKILPSSPALRGG